MRHFRGTWQGKRAWGVLCALTLAGLLLGAGCWPVEVVVFVTPTPLPVCPPAVPEVPVCTPTPLPPVCVTPTPDVEVCPPTVVVPLVPAPAPTTPVPAEIKPEPTAVPIPTCPPVVQPTAKPRPTKVPQLVPAPHCP